MVEGEGEAEEEDVGGVGPDLFRMDQADCQCCCGVEEKTDLGCRFRLCIGKSEGLYISGPHYKDIEGRQRIGGKRRTVKAGQR